MRKWMGTTSAEMNNKAAIGFFTREDLTEWAEEQNYNMCSIQWKVGEAEVSRGSVTLSIPFLYAEDLDPTFGE